MVTTRSGKATTPSTPPKNSAAKPKRERRERARDMIVCPARKRTPKRPNSDNVLRDFKTPSKRFVTLIVFPYAARSGGYNPRPRYGGDGFYMDRPKPRSNTNDTGHCAEAASAHARHIFSSTFGFDSDGDSHSSMSSRRRQLRRGIRGRLRGPIRSPPGNVRWAGRKVTSSSHKVTSYSQCSG